MYQVLLMHDENACAKNEVFASLSAVFEYLEIKLRSDEYQCAYVYINGIPILVFNRLGVDL